MKPWSPIRVIKVALACLSISILSACAAAAPSGGLANRSSVNPVAPQQPAADTSGGRAAAGPSSAEIATRLVVRNASLTLIVQDTQAQMELVNTMTTDLGGYIASSNTQKFEQGLQARITLRIPSDKLDTALGRLHKMATEVREESISGEDVTAEYTDLNSQLTNLQAAEIQLRDIMSKTTKTEDVISVFKQLTDIRGQIEQTKGRMQFLSQSASLATINVTLIPDALAQPLQIAGWHPEGVVKSAFEALVNALQVIVNIAIWLVVFVLPVVIIIAIPFAVIIILLRRRNRRKLVVTPSPTAEKPTQDS